MNQDTINQFNFFYCYDEGLTSYLIRKGFRYITKARHYRTNKLFSLFILTDELNHYINEWNNFINQ